MQLTMTSWNTLNVTRCNQQILLEYKTICNNNYNKDVCSQNTTR